MIISYIHAEVFRLHTKVLHSMTWSAIGPKKLCRRNVKSNMCVKKTRLGLQWPFLVKDNPLGVLPLQVFSQKILLPETKKKMLQYEQMQRLWGLGLLHFTEIEIDVRGTADNTRMELTKEWVSALLFDTVLSIGEDVTICQGRIAISFHGQGLQGSSDYIVVCKLFILNECGFILAHYCKGWLR